MSKKIITTYINDLKATLDILNIEHIAQVIKVLENKLKTQKNIFLAGNGGSAATASHAVCDLNKTVLGKHPEISDKLRFKAICLSDNIPLLTAIGNDISYDHIFSEQLKNYAQTGDLVIAITGSGNSPNILKALEIAQSLNLETVGFLGFDGGKAKQMVNLALIVPSNDYGIIEDIHMMLIHLITRYFREYNQKDAT